MQEILRRACHGRQRGRFSSRPSEVPFDGLAIAQALAAELRDGGYDLILFGRMATDTANGTVGPMTAELLGLPCVTVDFASRDRRRPGTARRDLEGAAETVQFPLPAVLTIDEGIARPRLASLKGIMAAKKKPLEAKPAQLGRVRPDVERMELPADRPPGGSSARAPTRCPSCYGSSRPKPRCCDGPGPGVCRSPSRRASEGGVRDGHRGAPGGRLPRAAAKCMPCSSALPGIAANAPRRLGGTGPTSSCGRAPGLERYNPEVFAATVAERINRANTGPRSSPPRPRAGTWRRGWRPRLGVSLASDVTGVRAPGRAVIARHPRLYRQGQRHSAADGHARAALAPPGRRHPGGAAASAASGDCRSRPWTRPRPG